MNYASFLKPTVIISACTMVLTACTTTPITTNPQQMAPVAVVPSQQYQPTPIPAYNTPKPAYTAPINNNNNSSIAYTGFSQWKADFASKSKAKGFPPRDVQRLLQMAEYNERTISLDSNQAEFVKMPWDYVERAVSSAKVSKGKRNFADNRALFSRIKRQYNISPYVVASIWGMESAYGAVTGSSNLVSSLSSLAYDGRRRTFAESQLQSLLTLLERGDVNWSHIEGSWAGGMGHTQFIPATWLAQGVDADGDGRRNPWSKADALSSTANYLTNSGWVEGLTPFVEVTLPSNFNYSQTGQTKSIAQWQGLGVNVLDNSASSYLQTKLWLPAGKNGPALLLTKNFNVIKVYNNSSSYALAVSLLAKRIAGESGLSTPWPKYEQALTKGEVTMLQQKLTDQGYDTQGVDGVLGTNTRKAFQRWQASNGQVADGFVCQRTTRALLQGR